MLEVDNKFAGYVGFVVLAVVLLIISALITGWAVSTLWGWFIVPLGVEDITYIHAIGVAIFIGMFTNSASENSDKDNEWLAKAVAKLLWPVLAVGLGWIVVQFS